MPPCSSIAFDASRASLTFSDSARSDAANTRNRTGWCPLEPSVFGEGVIGITIQPPLTRLIRSDHRVGARMRMLAGVLVGRAVAAERDAALLAGAQVHPPRAGLYALDALAAPGVPHVLHGAQMAADLAGGGHARYSASTW